VAITFPGITGTGTFTTATPSFTLSGGTPQENDIIFAVVASTTTAQPNSGTFDGFAHILASTAFDVESDSHEATMVWRRYTAADVSANKLTFTLTNFYNAAETGAIAAVVIRGVSTDATPYDVFQTTFSSTNTATPWVIPSLTPTVDGVQVIGAVIGDGTQSITTGPSGWTSRVSNTATQAVRIYSRDALGSNGVATGAANATPSSGDEYVGFSIAFKDAAFPQTLTMPAIASTAILYAPTVTVGSVGLSMPFIASGLTLYAPTVTNVPPAQTLTMPFITSTAALYAPTVARGPVTLSPPLIASTAALYAPTVTRGPVTVAMPFIASTAVLYVPTVTRGAVTLAMPFRASTLTLYPPTVTRGPVTLTMPFISGAPILYPPAVTRGPVALTTPLIPSTLVLFPPTVGGTAGPVIFPARDRDDLTTPEKPLTFVERRDIPSPYEVEDIFASPVAYVIRRCDILNSDLSIWRTNVGIVSGSVNIDMGRPERRSGDLALDNTAGDLVIDPDDGIWYDKIIRLWRGVAVGDEAHCWVLGTFLIDRLADSSTSATLNITYRDFAKKMIQSKFAHATTFTAGTDIATVIKTLALNSGLTKVFMPITGKQLSRDFTFESGASRWDAAYEIATAYAYEIFCDPYGTLVLRYYTDPIVSPVSLVLSASDDGSADGVRSNVGSYEKSSSDARLYNHIVVKGESTGTAIPVIAEAENTEPTSPTRIARIGRRTYNYSSQFLTTEPQCQETANKFLAVHSLEQYEISTSGVVYPWLDVGTTVEFKTGEASRFPTRFLLKNLSIPLGLGEMSASASRVSIVG
jgi:hypothetical protein